MTEEEKLSMAIELMRQGKCTDSALRNRGIPQREVFKLILKAEAAYVNEIHRVFPKPLKYKEQDHGSE